MSTTPALPAPGPAPFRFALTREITCIRSLAWRTDLPTAIDWPRLSAALAAAGLVRRPAVGAMQRFATARGDEVSLIPTTGRVQLRVHYTVPEHERRFAAERLFQLVFHALRRP
jgi:hypothetical protein